MFVRKKTNRSGSISIQIVQKIHRKNTVLKTIGCSKDPEELEKLYQIALYELPRVYGATLFDPQNEPKISELSNDCIRIIGPELIFGAIYDRIGFDKIKDTLLRDLAISRITHPGSKLKLTEYLNDTGKAETSVYSIYRFLDKLNTRLKDQVEGSSSHLGELF